MTLPSLFVYGTLQDPDIVSAVLGRSIQVAGLRTATAPGYLTVHYPGRVYPALIVAPGSAANGLLLDQPSERDLAALDQFEGDEYRRSAIIVVVEGADLLAQAYLPVSAIAPDSPPWTLDAWTRLHKATVIDAETEIAAAIRRRLTDDNR